MENDDRQYRIALLIARMRAGLLTPPEENELNRWISGSDENRRLYEQWQRGEGLQQDYLNYSRYDTDRLREDMKKRIASHRPSPRRKARRIAMVGSAVAAAAILAGVFLWTGNDGEPQHISLITPGQTVLYFEQQAISLDSVSVTMSEGRLKVVGPDGSERIIEPGAGSNTESIAPPEAMIIVPRGRIFDMALEDGSRVYLNAGTVLRYPISFDGKVREVNLEGEAYFEVVPDAGKPFRVITANQSIEVLGTEFNVDAYPESHRTSTTVLGGEVRVSHNGNTAVLTPRMQAVSGGDLWNVGQVKTGNIIGWRSGSFNLEKKPLEEVMAELSRWYDFEVVYEEEQLRGIVFRGTVPRYESFDRILELMQRTGEVRFEVSGKTVTVRSY